MKFSMKNIYFQVCICHMSNKFLKRAKTPAFFPWKYKIKESCLQVALNYLSCPLNFLYQIANSISFSFEFNLLLGNAHIWMLFKLFYQCFSVYLVHHGLKISYLKFLIAQIIDNDVDFEGQEGTIENLIVQGMFNGTLISYIFVCQISNNFSQKSKAG